MTALHASSRAFCFLGLLLLVGAAAGCGRAHRTTLAPQDGFTVTLATEPDPPVVGPGLTIVSLKDRAGNLVHGAQLTLEANMTHAGMVPVTGQGSESQDGLYRVPLQWTMAGDWYLDVAFSLPDGQTITRRFSVLVR